jgi:putative ABC transport system permease protein
VIRQGLSLAIVGGVIGLIGALMARRLTSGLLFGISAMDPATLAGGAMFLIAVAALACAIPGMRAMRIPLVDVLRED